MDRTSPKWGTPRPGMTGSGGQLEEPKEEGPWSGELTFDAFCVAAHHGREREEAPSLGTT